MHAAHRIALAPGWELAREFIIRGAGFDFGRLQRLVPEGLAAARAQVLAMDHALQASQQQLLAAVNRTLDGMNQDGAPEQRQACIALLRWVKGGRRAKAPWPDHLEALVGDWQLAQQRLRDARDAFAVRYLEGLVTQKRALADAAGCPRFQEAVIWQNPGAFSSAVHRVATAAGDGVPNSQQRQHLELVAAYLQRYAAKNDTIGFFGPSAWGEWTEDAVPPVHMAAGAGELACRASFFEAWAVNALADAFNRLPELQRWAAPRRSPLVHLEGVVVHYLGSRQLPCTALECALLALCNGERTPHQLAAELRGGGWNLSTADVENLLAPLVKKGAAIWKFEVPELPGADDRLERQLRRVGDPVAMHAALEKLQTLRGLKTRVDAARGDPQALHAAMQSMGATFESLTGKASARLGGRTYAGRTLVYEDTARDLSLRLGRPVLDALAPALSLVLSSVRWLFHASAAPIRARLEEVQASLSARLRVESVPMFQYVRALMQGPNPVDLVASQEFAPKWAALVGTGAPPQPGRPHRIQLRTEDIGARAEEQFRVTELGWQTARLQCPDLMIGASDLEAIASGSASFVLGEIHVGMDTLMNWVFLAVRPDAAHYAGQADLDFAQPVVHLLPPRGFEDSTTRNQLAALSSRDYLVGANLDASACDPGRILGMATLVVEHVAGRLVVRDRDRQLVFDAMEFFSHQFAVWMNAALRFSQTVDHAPRVTVDRLVISRETWRLRQEELAPLLVEDRAERYLGAGRLQARLGLPRYVFCRVASETKPFFVDLDAPVFVDQLVRCLKSVRESAPGTPVVLSEMLPGPDELWMRDAEGRRYTCELRMKALDSVTPVTSAPLQRATGQHLAGLVTERGASRVT